MYHYGTNTLNTTHCLCI